MHIHIHKVEDNIEELHSFCHGMIAASYYPAYSREAMAMFRDYHSLEQMQSDAAAGRVWAAREEGRIVGTVTVAGGELGRMFVLPECRGRGVGSELIRGALAYAWETGLPKLTAWSVPFSRGFYEKFGFRMVNADTLDFNYTRDIPVPYIEMAARPESAPGIAIERAAPGDIADMLAGQRLAFEEQCRIYGDWDIPPMKERPEDVEEFMRAGGVVLKAVCQGRVIGAVRGKASGGVGDVGRLYVLPDWQGRGAARMLVASVEEAMRDVRSFSIFTGERSEKNIALYQKQGYSLTGRRSPARAPGSDGQYDLVWLEKPNPWPEIEGCARRFHGL
jgi:GNAT superfamily N-acetyltransferase